MTLSAYSRKPAELEIPSFGLIGFAGPTAPAIFELLFDAAADYGVRNTATGKVMARIQVLPARSKPRKLLRLELARDQIEREEAAVADQLR